MTSTNALLGVTTDRMAAVEVPVNQAAAFEAALKNSGLPVQRQKGIFYALLRTIFRLNIYYLEGSESTIQKFEELAVNFDGASCREKEED